MTTTPAGLETVVIGNVALSPVTLDSLPNDEGGMVIHITLSARLPVPVLAEAVQRAEASTASIEEARAASNCELVKLARLFADSAPELLEHQTRIQRIQEAAENARQ